MRIRKLDQNNDWCFGLQNSSYLTEASAIGLDIKTKLQEWYQDCYFNKNAGIPWDVRLGSKNQKQLLDEDVYITSNKTVGVIDIQNFQSVVYDRKYRANFDVLQQYDTTPITIEFTFRSFD